MNIKRAKQEIKDSIQAYLLKNEYGEYEIPVIRQRPILMIGAPGIGKTQIMEQIAQECKVGLVSYTITHHTRQSAIGLPFISKKEYGGVEYAVTEYTMSEIVASIYNEMEKTGLREGILFIDEINCVSETLAPAMLQFLQCKTFGNHAIPQGWIIVAAGNPPEYNKSVREFDLVTLDRVKKMDVAPDFAVWKEYAYKAGIHAAVLSYLNIRKQYFYQMQTTVDGKLFATPRGWEDLSRILTVYEKLGKELDVEVIQQYIQFPKIAKDFANYLELYHKYQTDYQIEEVLSGTIDPILEKKLAHASFDERLSVVGLFLSRLFQDFGEYFQKEQAVNQIFQAVKEFRQMQGGSDCFEKILARINGKREEGKRAKIWSKEEEKVYRKAMPVLERYHMLLVGCGEKTPAELFELLRQEFAKEKQELQKIYEIAGDHLEHVLNFMESAFGESQEMVIFITELNANQYSVQYLQRYQCERYYFWNKQLLLEERHKIIQKKLQEL